MWHLRNLSLAVFVSANSYEEVSRLSWKITELRDSVARVTQYHLSKLLKRHHFVHKRMDVEEDWTSKWILFG